MTVFTTRRTNDRVVRRERRDPDRRTRRRTESGREDRQVRRREPRVHHLLEVVGGDAADRLGTTETDVAVGRHLDRHAQRCDAGALADADLQHPELALLDGELEVQHVAVVGLHAVHVPEQLLEQGGEAVTDRGERFGVAHPGDDVLTLGVEQEVAVGDVLPRGGVAGEGHAGAGVVVAVAEDHRLDVDRGAELVADLLALAVGDRPVAVPRAEHRVDRGVELGAGVLGERLLGVLADRPLVAGAQRLPRCGAELGDVGDTLGSLGGVLGLVEHVAIDAAHDLAEHGQQPGVGAVGETLVTGLAGEALHAAVVETQVEHRVHHPGHRELRPRADRHQQRVGGVTELRSHRLLELGEVPVELGVEPRRPTVVHVAATGVGGDGEAGRHREAEHRGHLGEVGSLAPQLVLELHRSAAVTVVEGVDERHAADGSNRNGIGDG